MRVMIAIFLGATLALAVPAGPVLAKTPDAQKTSDQQQSAAPTCDGYEQNPDGSWTHTQCQEVGSDNQAGPKAAPRSTGKASH
jgi:hypothetical protein